MKILILDDDKNRLKIFDDEKFVLDIDRNRIKTILSEAYKICGDFLETEFSISNEDFIKQIDPYLDCNRIAIPVRIVRSFQEF
jgi:hypothetical protein